MAAPARGIADGRCIAHAAWWECWRSLAGIVQTSTAATWREAFLAALVGAPDEAGWAAPAALGEGKKFAAMRNPEARLT